MSLSAQRLYWRFRLGGQNEEQKVRCLDIGLLRASAIIGNYGHRQNDTG